ncbi:sensor histidine kinase [Ciceribacter azotifigens]|uniref:sensor histidine kinase n=1 Tax=Ciceribacter azotifigens TaxID=2069303 RepID=UPI003A85111D
MHSIRSRFFLVSVATVLLALTMASLVFIELFRTNLERRVDQELTNHINNIAGALRVTAEGKLELPKTPTDLRFQMPYGGLYWQAEDDVRKHRLRSPSLWDYVLALPVDTHESGEIHRYHLKGPDETDLIVQERKVILAAPEGEREIRIAAAIDAAELAKAGSEFARDMLPYSAALAIFLIAASLAQLTFGLRPISSVSEGLNRIRERKADRLTGRFPEELRPVVEAVNRLLDSQSEILTRARAAAGDLAHGLKTPLTILANDAETLRERGETELAHELAHIATVMQAHVDRELTRSRLAVNAELHRSVSDLRDTVQTIVRTLKRTPLGEHLDWRLSVPPDVVLDVDPHDLHELIGNILENASKWSRSWVSVRHVERGDDTVLIVEDDGPGADAEGISLMTERGMRLDTQKPGTGIGLAIVRDIAAAYEIDLRIENRDEGGLRVTLGFGAVRCTAK